MTINQQFQAECTNIGGSIGIIIPYNIKKNLGGLEKGEPVTIYIHKHIRGDSDE